MERVHTLVVGGGPAGLAAGQALDQQGVDYLIVDQGRGAEDRDHYDPADVPVGVGGAGLFSDGKFSFYPANSTAYATHDHAVLAEAYAWISVCLAQAGAPAAPPPLPSAEEIASRPAEWLGEKRFPTVHLPLAHRRRFMDSVIGLSRPRIRTGVRLVGVRDIGAHRVATLTADGSTIEIDHTALVLATGRMAPLTLGRLVANLGLTTIPLRYELGVRVEHPQHLGFLGQTGRQTDFKRIWRSGGIQYRTFCSCRRGEMWALDYPDALSAVSGRSEEIQTEFSNFSLLARFADAGYPRGERLFSELRERQRAAGGALVAQRLTDFLAGEPTPDLPEEPRPWHARARLEAGRAEDLLGEELGAVVRVGLDSILADFPDLVTDETWLLAPTIEGVGAYCEVDPEYRTSRPDVFVVGDAVGRVRGIVASMISGYIAGAACARSAMQPAA